MDSERREEKEKIRWEVYKKGKREKKKKKKKKKKKNIKIINIISLNFLIKNRRGAGGRV